MASVTVNPPPDSPLDPRPWRVKYLQLRRVSPSPARRYANRVFHGLSVGCYAGRPSDPGNTSNTEAMIYRDVQGGYWMLDIENTPETTEPNGWRRVSPCGACGLIDIDRVLSERLEWMHLGRCYRTEHPGFFVTSGGDRKSPNNPLRREALKMCLGDPSRAWAPCPVLSKCRDWGLRLHAIQPYVGILGGIDEDDRKKVLQCQG